MNILLAMPGGSEWMFIVIALLPLVPIVFYLIMIQSILRMISIENQKMNPDLVWLMLIPIFGFVWQFIFVKKVSDSLKAEFIKMNILINEEIPGFSIGISYYILFCCLIIPKIGIIAFIGGVICWVIYWNRIKLYKNQLISYKR